MNLIVQPTEHDRYTRALTASKRARWNLEEDLLRGRRLDLTQKFLPDGLSQAPTLDFLSEGERRFISQIQGTA